MNFLKASFELLTYNTLVSLIGVVVVLLVNILTFLNLYDRGTSIRERLSLSAISITTAVTVFLLSVIQVGMYGILVEETSKKSVKEVVGRGNPIINSKSDYKNKTIEWTVFTGNPDNKSEYTDKSFYKTYKTDDETKSITDSYEVTLPIDKLMSYLDSKLGEAKE